jgi:signal transduction histidine kinase/ActR/RegA family two-component response regulator
LRPHRLLDRQLRKLGLTNGALPTSLDSWNALLDRISTTYAEADEDRYLLERSLSISSREMRELSQTLQSNLEKRVAERTEELERARRRLKSQERALVDLARVASLPSDNLESELRHLTAGSAQTLVVERVSLWLFNAERTAIVCWDLYELTGGQHSAGATLETASFPTYFAGIPGSDVIAADDAQADPQTRELTDSYLKPLSITSKMDIPIRVRGETMGILCHEHTGLRRSWEADEESFALAVAGLAALAIVGYERWHALRELEKARAAAESATRAKSHFLASISHEIRTPLNAIIGMSELLQRTPLLDPQREYLGTIHTASEILLALVNETLDFSKIEAGKLDLESTPFDLQKCLEQALNLVAPKAKAKGLELRCTLGRDMPRRIVADPTRLRQILVNLLDNAVKFTARGHVAVTAEWQASAGVTGELHLSVSDTGIGIPANGLSSIFTAFLQVDTATTRQYGGTGLGLAIVERLCELMGGSVTVESEEGRGSTFRVRIRAATAGEVASPPAETDHSSRLPAVPPLRILLVEDNPVNQLVVVRMLESLGYASPLVAADGEEALEVLHGERCDLVLMDLHMPRMDGIEASLRIRDVFTEEERPAIIALTADAIEESRIACRDAGMAGFLTKPFRLEELQACLEQFEGAAVTKRP